MRTFDREIRLGILALMLLATIFIAYPVSAGDDVPAAAAVDLATVPLLPEDLPESGFQFAQGGAIDLSGLHYAWSGDGFDQSEWETIDDGWTAGHTQVLVLLTDRGDSFSEPLATLTTFVLEFADAGAATDAVADLLEIAGYDPTDEIDGVTVHEDRNGVLGAIADDEFVVITMYAASVTDGSGQNTEDWTPDAIAGLTLETVDRLDDAREAAAEGEPSLGIGNLLVTGARCALDGALALLPRHGALQGSRRRGAAVRR